MMKKKLAFLIAAGLSAGSALAAPVTLQMPAQYYEDDNDPWYATWHINEGTPHEITLSSIRKAVLNLTPGLHKIHAYSRYESTFAATIKVDNRTEMQCFTMTETDEMSDGEGHLPHEATGITTAGKCFSAATDHPNEGRTIRRYNHSSPPPAATNPEALGDVMSRLDRLKNKELTPAQMLSALQLLPQLQQLIASPNRSPITRQEAVGFLNIIRQLEPNISEQEQNSLVTELNTLRSAYQNPNDPHHKDAVMFMSLLGGAALLFQGGTAGGDDNPLAALAAAFGGDPAENPLAAIVQQQMNGAGEDHPLAALANAFGANGKPNPITSRGDDNPLAAVAAALGANRSQNPLTSGGSDNPLAALATALGAKNQTDTTLDANGSDWCTAQPYCAITFHGREYRYPLGWKIYPPYFEHGASQPSLEAERRSDGIKAWINVSRLQRDDCQNGTPNGRICFDPSSRPISTQERKILSGQ